MMQRLIAALAAFLFAASAMAQTVPFGSGTPNSPIVITPQNGLLPTNGVQTCGTQATKVGTFNAQGQALPLNCPGAGSYDVRIVPNASAPLVGTFSSADLSQPLAPSGRRLYKNGVGPLEVSTESLTAANTTPLTYRTNGGDNLTLTLTSYTSGSADVYISASYAASMVLINGSIDTREEAALRQGKAFTASTGAQTVTAGQYLSLELANPSTSGVRLVIPSNNRIFGCNNPSNAALPVFQSRPNVATNAPATAVNITRRGGTTGTSAATVTSANSANLPDTNPATTNPVGLPFFGSYAIPQDRTLEPGSTITLTVLAVGTGLAGAANPTCSIIASWFEESLQ